MTATPKMTEHLDVLVIGAGLSGVGAGVHLQQHCPGKTYAILEGREALGGTWDLFRYPGIRSDSDMHTLGYSFRPWTEAKAIADGPAILKYVQDTARDYGVDQHIRFAHWVTAAHWSSEDARWHLTVHRKDTDETIDLTCNFLFVCSGYYNYDKGHTPAFDGADDFEGQVIHPQHWPEDLDYSDKRVVVIGSGATAVTLVPAMTDRAAHVTMLQRTPSYVVTRPAEDAIANALRRRLPDKLAYGMTRWKNVVMGQLFYRLCQRAPGPMKRLIMSGVRKELGEGVDVDTHFNPPYGPWDQRLCLVPDADLFEALRGRKASVVTGYIDRFTKDGIRLKDGQSIDADIIVTATGLEIKVMGGIEITVDGEPVVANETMSYKAMMFSDVPNLAMCFGYTNASWTLKADLTSVYVCRLLNHMDQHGHSTCVPKQSDPSVEPAPFMDLDAGYIRRAQSQLPVGGSKTPWKLKQNYLFDLMMLRMGRVDDGVMQFR